MTSYDCIGIGCGPSNLSVASLLHGSPDLRSIFFDQKPEFAWHDGMMLSDVGLQVSLFKDLVTLADPSNRFSFISYLHGKGRLHQFLNAGFSQISRQEFSDYMKWAADGNEDIHFGERVLRVDFDGSDFVVETTKRDVRSANVTLGVGVVAEVPEFARRQLDGETQFHIHDFASRPRRLGGRRIVVVGGGQSGAEAVLELLRRRGVDAPTQLTWISRRENFFPIDDSPFANDFFTPTHSDYFFARQPSYRKAFLQRNVLASDGISGHTLRDIYQRIYTLRYVEQSPMRVELMPFRDVQEVWRDGVGWRLAAGHLADNKSETLGTDVLIWASGFRSATLDFLEPLQRRFEREGPEFRIDQDYAAVWDGPRHRNLFLLNSTRRQRGLPDPNLSLTAWRSQAVINRMLQRPRTALKMDDAFVSWAATTDDSTQALAPAQEVV
ncbi:MAG: SidA/IucD/PvdA family monooxygenase [Ramlibacter sp.]|nr:SidA/IucD/PvdA family monooxygenase [Ramlibacter sp.]